MDVKTPYEKDDDWGDEHEEDENDYSKRVIFVDRPNLNSDEILRPNPKYQVLSYDDCHCLVSRIFCCKSTHFLTSTCVDVQQIISSDPDQTDTDDENLYFPSDFSDDPSHLVHHIHRLCEVIEEIVKQL